VGKRIKKSKMNFRSACTIFGGGLRATPARGPTTPCGTHSMGERHKVIRLQITVFKSPAVYSNHKPWTAPSALISALSCKFRTLKAMYPDKTAEKAIGYPP
jgi:hypothetical protein